MFHHWPIHDRKGEPNVNRHAYLAVFFSLLFSAIVLLAAPTLAAFNQQINYQGKLASSTGDVVQNATYTFAFKLYTASSGGVAIWTETASLPTTNGLFSHLLGSVTPLTDSVFNQDLWLGVTVGSDSEMTPRKKIGAQPAAFEAKRLSGKLESEFGTLGESETVTGTWTFTATTTLATTSITDFTAGSIVFVGANSVLTQDNSGLYWDSSNDRLGIGITSPSFNLAVSGTSFLGATATVHSIIPSTTALYNLGSASIKWNYVYSTNVSADELVASTGITLGGDRRTSWPTSGSGGESLWATNSAQTLIYPQSNRIAVVGGTATTSADTKLEVIGNAKISGQLTVTSTINATQAGIAFVNDAGITVSTTGKYGNANPYSGATGFWFESDIGAYSSSLYLDATHTAVITNLGYFDVVDNVSTNILFRVDPDGDLMLRDGKAIHLGTTTGNTANIKFQDAAVDEVQILNAMLAVGKDPSSALNWNMVYIATSSPSGTFAYIDNSDNTGGNSEAGIILANFDANDVAIYLDQSVDQALKFSFGSSLDTEAGRLAAVKAMLSPDGRLSLATTSLGASLNIQGVGSNPALNIASSSGAIAMHIDAQNRVGIGTSTPTTTFYVAGTSTLQDVVPNMYGGTGNVSQYSLGSTTTRWSNLWTNSLYLGPSTWKMSQSGTALVFAGLAGTATTSLSLFEGRGIGIGTSTEISGHTIHIAGAGRFEPVATPSAPVNGSMFYDLSTDRFNFYQGNRWMFYAGLSTTTIAGTGNNKPVAFFNDEDTVSNASNFVFNTVGYLGIGTSSASAPLHVAYNPAATAILLADSLLAPFSRQLEIRATGTAIYIGNLASQSLGSSNTTLGANAGYGMGSGNVFIGTGAGASSGALSGLTFVGSGAGGSNTSGLDLAAVGASALGSNTSGKRNSAMGASSMLTNTDGESNAAFGYYSLQANNNGDNNTAMGARAGASISGDLNTVLGYNAANITTTPLSSGIGNTIIGAETGGITTENYNVLLGYNLTAEPGFDSSMWVDVNAGPMDGAYALVADFADNQVGINTTRTMLTARTEALVVQGAAANNTGVWASLSDMRLKENITDLKGSTLDIISKLRPVTFAWNDLASQKYGLSSAKNYGFIAQEIEQVIPEYITKTNDGFLEISPSGYNAILTAAIQEQEDKIKALQAKMDLLPANSLIVTNGGGINYSLTQLKNDLSALGIVVRDDGMLEIGKLKATRVQSNEFEMVDKKDGKLYCTWIEDGNWQKREGACEISPVIIETTLPPTDSTQPSPTETPEPLETPEADINQPDTSQDTGVPSETPAESSQTSESPPAPMPADVPANESTQTTE